jgi:Tfp pilus assembly protein PilN
MRAVNLLPREPVQSGFERSNLPVLGGGCAALLAAAALAAAFMMQSGKVSREQGRLDTLQARVAALPPIPTGPTSAESKLAGQHNGRLAAVTAALGTRVSWDRVFREFSLVLPDDVWLTSLSVQSPVSPAATTTAPAPTSGQPTGFVIQGHTYSHDGVARLLSRLQLIPDLQNVTLVSSTLGEAEGQSVVEFSIAASIRTASGSAAQ